MRGLLAGLGMLISVQVAAAAAVEGVRLSADLGATRVVLDTAGKIKYRVNPNAAEHKVIVELENAAINPEAMPGNARKGLLRGMSAVAGASKSLKMVLDVAPGTTVKSFALGPNAPYGYRIVIDLRAGEPVSLPPAKPEAPLADVNTAKKTAKPVAATAELPNKPVKKLEAPLSTKPEPERFVPQFAPTKPFVVAIDAGHGGKDPGAHGMHGTYEKQVTLAIARKLAKLINSERGMRAVLIRDGDYYIGLRQRIVKARQHKADLFLSIHADAFTRRDAKGSSVYVLSERGASSEAARWIAAQENSVDLVGGVSLDDKDQLLASVLLDLSQAATIESSMDLGGHVLKSLGNVGPLHRTRVERAGFMVLKSPDIPSILVETAFISNPDEERKLASSSHQTRLAEAILSGIRGYVRRAAPVAPPAKPSLRTAEREQESAQPTKAKPKQKTPKEDKRAHVVAPGDTLGSISKRYNVSKQEIRLANSLSQDQLRVGSVVDIPN